MIYVTPEEYHKRNKHESLERLIELRDAPDDECQNCSNPVWKLIGDGLCFQCTTGEADDSNDFELI